MKFGMKALKISNVLTVVSIIAMLAVLLPLAASAADLSVTPVFREVTETEGATTFDVANAGTDTMEWTAESNDSWLVIDSGSSGTDSGTITVGYETNTGDARTGAITVTAPDATNSPQTVEVRQGVFGPRIVQYSPFAPVNMLTDTLDFVTVTFSEAIDYASDGSGSFDLDDVIITGPNGEIIPTGIVSLGDNEHEISFAAQASLGTYTVSVGPDIADLVGNEMDQDRDGEFGEPEDDVFTFSIIADEQERIFWEGFEDPNPEWEISNGVWEVGKPTSGPSNAYRPPYCAATKLSGNYPSYTDSRLVSPAFDLPDTAELSGGEEVHLSFWHWFSYSNIRTYSSSSSKLYDKGYVRISVQDETTGAWSGWTNLSSINEYSVVWSLKDLNLTSYAGQRVRIGFYHTADRYGDYRSESTGWYIDDIEVVTKVPELTGDFESGWGDWSASNGLWQVGTPTKGPGSAHGGSSKCAGTVLGGNYNAYTDSWLISPPFELPEVSGGEEVHLSFWHWFSYSNIRTYSSSSSKLYDKGYVRISVQDETTGAWSGWEELCSFIEKSNGWLLTDLPLALFAGQRVKIGFYHTADRYGDYPSESSGWYIDDVGLPEINTRPTLVAIDNKEMDESGTLNVPLVATDPDGDTLTLSVSGLPSFGAFTDSGDGTGTIIFNPGPGDSGTYVMTVTASDGTSSDSESFTLEVTNTNQPPEITPIDDKEVNETETLSVGVTASDPDGDAVTLSVSDLPSFGAFTDNGDGTGTIVFNPGLDTSGYYVLTVTASDGALSDSESFTLKVNNYNQAPELTAIDDREMDMTNTLSVLVAATDPDLDAVSLSVSGLPTFATFTDNGDGTGTIVFSPNDGDDGVYSVTVTADDGTLSASNPFTLTVNAIPIPPNIANFTADQTRVGVGQNVAFTDQSTGNPVSWQWDFENNGTIDSTEQNPSHTYYKQGTYSVRLIVTNADSTYEHLKENYIRVVTPLPDLQVTELQHSQAVSGQTMEVSWTVTNTGAGTTNSPVWYDRIWISPDLDVRMAHREDRLLGVFENVSYLEPGESYMQTKRISLPNGLMGTYYLFVVTDNYDACSINFSTMEAYSHSGHNVNIVPELNDRNNFAFVDFDFTIPPSPDLQVTSVTVPDTGLSDQEIILNWTVANRGEVATGDTQWSDRVYICPNATLTGNAISLGTVSHTENLLVDGSYSASSSFTLPHAVYGDYYVLVVTDSSNRVNEYLFENNNTLCSETPVNIVLSPPPDLSVTEVATVDSASCGQSVSVQWTVENQGPGATFETIWHDCIYISESESFNQATAQHLKSISRNGQLEPGFSYSEQTSVTIPDNTAGGYHIFVKTDCRNEVFEYAYETNNVLKSDSTIEVLAPDILAVEVSVPESGDSGREISISWTVENQGAGQLVSTAWKDKVYLSQSATFDQGSAIELASSSQSRSILPGAGYSASKTATLQNGISGDYYVFVRVDSDNSVFEDQGENNNITRSETTFPVELTPWPDLSVSMVDVPDSVTAGDRLNVSWQVGNHGVAGTQSGSWVDKIYLSSSAAWDGSYVSLASISQSRALDPSQTYLKTYGLKVKPGVAPGDYYVYAKTDADNVVYEHTDENNNMTRSDPVTILPYPPVDLVVTHFEASDSASSGQSVSMTWTIQNIGEARTLVSSWNDKIYLSSDTTLNTAEDILIKTASHSGTLDSQQEYSRAVTAKIPNGVSGNYYLIIKTDMDGHVSESNENNNTSSSSISIELTPPPDLQISSFEIPSEGTAGQPIAVSFTVENLGVGAASASEWYDAVYLSSNDVLDSGDTRLSTIVHKAVLNATESYDVSTEAELPIYVSGSYFVLIKTDNRNDVYEHNAEGNNVVSQPIAITMLPPADLVVTDITVPENAAPGDLVTITWTIENQGQNAAVGRMREGVYISEDNTWEYTDPMLGIVSRNINLVPGASQRMSMAVNLNETFAADSSGNITATLPGVTAGEHYIAVRTDLKNNIRESDLSNNTLVSDDVINVGVPPLQGNVPMEATVFGSNQKKYYQIDVAEGLDLKVTLTSDVPGAANELYVAFDRVPTLIDYDHAGNVPFTANQDILVPSTQAGTYYIMVYVRDLPSGVDSQNITLLVEPMFFSISSITPDAGGAGGRVTCTLTGAGFRVTTQVFLRLDDGSLLESKVVEFVNTMELRVRWDLSDIPLGLYDVVAINTNGVMAERAVAFAVRESTGMLLHTGILAPRSYRAGNAGTMVFYFTNTGNIDIPYLSAWMILPPYLEVTTIDNSPGLLKKSDLYEDILGSETENVFKARGKLGGDGEVEFKLAEVVAKDFAPGLSMQSTVVFKNFAPPSLPIGFSTKAMHVNEFILDHLLRIESTRMNILGNPDAYDDKVLELAENADVFVGTVLDYNYLKNGLIEEEDLNSNIMSMAAARVPGGNSTVISDVKTKGSAWDWYMCMNKYRSCIDACIGGLYYVPFTVLADWCIEHYCDPIKEQCQEIRNTVDPNELFGPTGFGYDEWISKNETLSYSIHFENDPELATAPAQVVSIRQQLDPDLDIRTFRLGSFGFGDHVFHVPENRAYYTGRLDVVDSLGVYVDVTAGIDVTTNEAFWTFRSIDPDTGLPPTNPLAGFLPVNDPETGVGQGFVTYTIRAKEDAVTGDVIDAQAEIVFDVNEPMETAPIFNTIDADHPSSEVQDSVNSVDDTTFEVSWTGQDVVGGSGLGGFDILVSDNGAAYEPWLSDTAETSAYFTGEPGHTYTFYSLARDYAGNVESPPDDPDLTVVVVNYAPSNPNPAHGAQGVTTNPTLSWNRGHDADTHDLYLWQDGEVQPATPLVSGLTETTYTPAPPLFYSTTYHWQVLAKRDSGDTYGPIWTFTTMAPVNQAPYIPSSPTPEDGATDISVDTELNWQGGDPDAADVVTYDVYLDQDNPPLNKVVEDHPLTLCPASGLAYDTTYYWKIVGRDNHGAETEGPIWNFTTFSSDGDADSDGLTNAQEVALGTDPFDWDTDDDGYSDGEEVQWGSDPRDKESIPNVECEGDFDADSDLDGSDLATFSDAFGSSSSDSHYNSEADFDDSGYVDEDDLSVFAPDLGRMDCSFVPVPGDLDGDGDVDEDDLSLFEYSLGSCEGDPEYNQEADYDGDGCVTNTDYVVWSGYYDAP